MSRDSGEPTAAVVGAPASGTALHLARLGIRTRLLAMANDDDVDREPLEEAGVELVVRTDPGAPLVQVVGGADVVLAALSQSVAGLLPQLQATGTELWVDLSDWDGEPSRLHDPFVDAGSHLFLSDLELADPLRTAEQLLPGRKLVVVTHGKRGATAFFPDTEPFFVLPHDAGPVVSTRGARDAFCGGTAYGRARGWDWPRALRAGSVVAGGCVSVAGTVHPDLTSEWLESRLDQPG